MKATKANPESIGKVVTVAVFEMDSAGDIILESLTKHVGTLEAYIVRSDSFEFKLVGMNLVEAQYAEIYSLGKEPNTGWRLGTRPRSADPMSPEEIATLRSNLRLTRGELSLKLGVTPEHVRLLENGKRKPSEPINQLLHELEAPAQCAV